VVQLNNRIADYEKRRRANRKKFDAYNTSKPDSTDTD
jgi:hypothetical protein